MTIANPIYDIVFKYLMEDDDTMRRKMNIEDEIERDYQEIEEKFHGLLEEKNQEIEQNKQEIEQKDLLIEELKRQLGLIDR
jgi:HEAT repeat protein